ncbi:MAG: OmpH family outer membrane protein [Bacteroidales bacterium]|jgi:outer membrane protein
MKHFSKFLLILFVFATSTSFAQTFKFGHINSQELIALMPDRDSAVLKLDIYGKQLQQDMDDMQAEFQTKMNIYQQKQATWTAVVLEDRQKELQQIQARFEAFQANAQQEYQQMQQLLYAPVYQKANETLIKIGKDNGFTYIFDISTGSIPFFNEAQSTDVMPMAKTMLKIPADKKPMAIPSPADKTATQQGQTKSTK